MRLAIFGGLGAAAILIWAYTSDESGNSSRLNEGQDRAQANAPVAIPFRELKKGECVDTAIRSIGGRFMECVLGNRGEVTHRRDDANRTSSEKWDCGLTVYYWFDDVQTSYQTNLSVKDDWRIGDPIKLCRVDEPEDCPSGIHDESAIYLATNLRTDTNWQMRSRIHSYCAPVNLDEKECKDPKGC
jgi:hypothetical protein